ncbi:MAG: NAD(P)(+) transhydrogenase (Re/Si-specific) subunit beta [Eubacteriales bacterium]|nr:NAD(P)(+) transhydrogenase (Re/Si-specific) subunit beta [Eubacteriales bacterium]
MTQTYVDIAYIVACVFFILGIKKLGRSRTARQGNLFSMIGMSIAVVAVFFESSFMDSWSPRFLNNGYFYAVLALAIGSLLGTIWAKRVQMIDMPQLVALFNGFGGLSSLLVALAEFSKYYAQQSFTTANKLSSIALGLTIIIGAVTFTGSVLAWAKLAGRMNGKAIRWPGQNLMNFVLLVLALGATAVYVLPDFAANLKLLAIVGSAIISLLLGVTFVIAIGGGDMPIIISLLNSFSGLAASMAGFAIDNNVLVVAGCLVGASGIILTIIMCKAMNKALFSLLFAKYKAGKKSDGDYVEPKSLSVEDAFPILEAAQSVVFIPGYGMAVAQAQHVVKELAQKLEDNGCEVSYVIHPVAGRMPGHMNVLLAEADIDYDQLLTMEEMNPLMGQQDLAIIIGANDVVNPVAEDDPDSPIYGMPIIQAYKANTVFVLKRGQGMGYSGLENTLFTKDNTVMIYGDAKSTISAFVKEFQDLAD